MDPVMISDLVAGRAEAALSASMSPSLLPLPRIPVSAEVWKGERHVRLHGEAIYAIHSAGVQQWAVVVEESTALEPGSVELVDLTEIRCESVSGRRGR